MAAVAATVVVEASAKSPREDAEASAPSRAAHPPLAAPLPPRVPSLFLLRMAKRLLSRALRHPVLPSALSRFLSAEPTPTRSEPEEDKGKKMAATASMVVEASANSPREDTEASAREGLEDEDEDAGIPWRDWSPDVIWLSKALEPALQLYNKQPLYRTRISKLPLVEGRTSPQAPEILARS